MIVHPSNMPFPFPGRDFITEEALNPNEPVVNCRMYFDPGVVTHLNGHKCVNLSTVKLLAQILGYELVPSGSTLCECSGEPEEPKPLDPEIAEALEVILRRHREAANEPVPAGDKRRGSRS